MVVDRECEFVSMGIPGGYGFRSAERRRNEWDPVRIFERAAAVRTRNDRRKGRYGWNNVHFFSKLEKTNARRGRIKDGYGIACPGGVFYLEEQMRNKWPR
jgi:hypothetical protein